MSKADLYRSLGMDPKSSLLSAYEKGRSKPSFEICDKLIRLGMTVEELFGIEYAKMHFMTNNGNIKISNEDLGMAFLRAAEILGCKKNPEDAGIDNGAVTQEVQVEAPERPQDT